MRSIWTKTATHIPRKSLDRSIQTDVLIIGGGMAGVLCAHALQMAGVDHVLVEATRIGGGITQDTTAKITLQHGLIYSTLIRRFGQEKAALYLQAQRQAIDTYAYLCETIDCDFERQDAYVYSLDDRDALERETAALERLGHRALFCETTPLPFRVAGAVRVTDQAQFHPLKFLNAICKGLPVYENTKVLGLMPHKAITEHGEITYKKMIIATHFPILNKHGGYFLKLYQHRSYVIALDGAPHINGMFVSDSQTGLSFRTYGDRLLLGGGAHRTGKQGGNWRELEAFANAHYPSAAITAKWATQDCMSLDGVPYIGQYSQHTPDVYVATGFNKWGMTSSMVAAQLLCDLVQEKDNAYASVFDPSRSLMHPQLAVNAFESITGLLTPTVPRCPHLGCALKYNRAEHSWDCPCHGSRFTENGKLINNPATDDKKI